MTAGVLAHSGVLLAHPASVLADDDTDKGSPIGLLVVLVLIVAVYLLYRSMNRHVRNLPESFDPPESSDRPEPRESSDALDSRAPDSFDVPGSDVPGPDDASRSGDVAPVAEGPPQQGIGPAGPKSA